VEVRIVAIWQRIASSTHARTRATLVDGLVQTAWWGWGDGVGSGRCRGSVRWACRDDP
jgi:hypothetical protein